MWLELQITWTCSSVAIRTNWVKWVYLILFNTIWHVLLMPEIMYIIFTVSVCSISASWVHMLHCYITGIGAAILHPTSTSAIEEYLWMYHMNPLHRSFWVWSQLEMTLYCNVVSDWMVHTQNNPYIEWCHKPKPYKMHKIESVRIFCMTYSRNRTAETVCQ